MAWHGMAVGVLKGWEQKTQFLFTYWADLPLKQFFLEFWTHYTWQEENISVSCHNDVNATELAKRLTSDGGHVAKKFYVVSELPRQISATVVNPYLESSFENEKVAVLSFFFRKGCSWLRSKLARDYCLFIVIIRLVVLPEKSHACRLARCSGHRLRDISSSVPLWWM